MGRAAGALGEGIDERVPLIPLAYVEIDDVDAALALEGLRDRAVRGEVAEFEVRAPAMEQLVAFQYIGTRDHHHHHIVLVVIGLVITRFSIGMGIVGGGSIVVVKV